MGIASSHLYPVWKR